MPCSLTEKFLSDSIIDFSLQLQLLRISAGLNEVWLPTPAHELEYTWDTQKGWRGIGGGDNRSLRGWIWAGMPQVRGKGGGGGNVSATKSKLRGELSVRGGDTKIYVFYLVGTRQRQKGWQRRVELDVIKIVTTFLSGLVGDLFPPRTSQSLVERIVVDRLKTPLKWMIQLSTTLRQQ